MEHHTGSDHAPDFGERGPQNTDHERARTPTGNPPRMFALVQELFYEENEDDERDEESVTEVVAYGLALPCGTAATVGANGRDFGRWTSAHSAARRLHSDLVWFGDSRRTSEIEPGSYETGP
ncbi:hypothetical protein [Streptosporangium sp. NBC_01469]|uniref:hypothetical protein n=1 Tax=Streptosporangium sp. NBC_01469 TaxID=2903898 RepID=UPI002E2C8257|nr:hypothetical protein [Streptosporangium sp. NBC_01469]